MRDLLDYRQPFLLPILAALAARIYFWVVIPNAYEDAYITFRFARNLVLGHGLVFNVGEKVMGFSSPLWTLWSALGYLITREPVGWARVFGVLADMVTMLTLGQMLRRHFSRASGWCFTAFFAAFPFTASWAISGMENSVILALVALTAALAERGSLWGGVTLAMVAFSRPEGAVMAVILMIFATNRQRLSGAVLAIAAYAALGAYFGTLVPQSVIAKSQVYGTPGPLAGKFWWQWFVPFVFGKFPDQPELAAMFPLSMFLAPAAVAGGIALVRKGRTGLLAVVCACAVVLLGYSMVGVAFFTWYLLLPMMAVVLLASVGLPSLVQGRWLYVSALAFLLGTWTVFPGFLVARSHVERMLFAEAADRLFQRGSPRDKVMLEPIGMVGWATGMRVVDEVGLVSPEVAKRRTQGPGWYADIVARERPDWLVVRRGMMANGEAFAGQGAPFRSEEERNRMLQDYGPDTLIAPEAGEGALAVLRRK